MKLQTLQSALKKFKLVYLHMAAFIMLSSVTPSAAKAGDSTIAPLELAQVKYLGVLDKDNVLFQVEFDNKNKEVIHLTITDLFGYVLYSEKFHDNKLTKKFLFNKLENGNANLVFTFRTATVRQSQSFKVDTEFVESTVVTKL